MEKIPKFSYLWQYVEHWAQKKPNFEFLRFNNHSIRAVDLWRNTCLCATHLRQIGISKGDRIVTILPTVPEYTYLFLAATMLGAITCPMDLRYRPADYKRYISHLRPKMMVLLTKIEDFPVGDVIQQLDQELNLKAIYYHYGPGSFGSPIEDLFRESTGNANPPEKITKSLPKLNPHDGVLIIFTGGTTGIPKSMLLNIRHVTQASYLEANHVRKALDRLGFHDTPKILLNLPPSHVGGTVEIQGTCLAGGYHIIMQQFWSPIPVLEAIQEHNITLIGAVPTMYAILLSLPQLASYNLSSVKLAIVGGEKLNLELIKGIKARICPNLLNGYGSTEFGPEVTFSDFTDPDEKLAEGYAGYALPGVELKVVDAQGKKIPHGQEGELLVRGVLTSDQYYDMPEETKATFTRDGWCRSGDLCYLTPEGGLFIKGRIKHIIRVGSYTVLPTEVEEVAMKHPKVALAAAIGVPDKIYTEILWLYVIPQQNVSLTPEELIAHCRTELADFKVPRKVIVTDNIPVTRLGKVDRVKLQEQVRDSLLSE